MYVSLGSGSYQDGGDEDSSVMSFETPPPSMMNNEGEGEGCVMPITLMYAQQPLAFAGTTGEVKATNEEKEKDMRELLEEQDIGEPLTR